MGRGGGVQFGIQRQRRDPGRAAQRIHRVEHAELDCTRVGTADAVGTAGFAATRAGRGTGRQRNRQRQQDGQDTDHMSAPRNEIFSALHRGALQFKRT